MERILIERLVAGDKKAFDALYSLYAKHLLLFALQQVRCVEDAEDLVQDVFVSLWINRGNIRNRDSISALLFTSLKNKIANYHRKRINSQLYADYVAYMAERAKEAHTSDIEYDEFYTQLKSMIERLPETQRKVIKLSKFDGCSNLEIAEKIGINHQSVKNALSVGLKTLKSNLNNLMDGNLPFIYTAVSALAGLLIIHSI